MKYLKEIIPENVVAWVRARYIATIEYLRLKSLQRALVEQGLLPIYKSLFKLVPDIKHQYSCFEVEGEYLVTKVRGLHAFQLSLAHLALDLVVKQKKDNITIVDSRKTNLFFCGFNIQ